MNRIPLAKTNIGRKDDVNMNDSIIKPQGIEELIALKARPYDELTIGEKSVLSLLILLYGNSDEPASEVNEKGELIDILDFKGCMDQLYNRHKSLLNGIIAEFVDFKHPHDHEYNATINRLEPHKKMILGDLLRIFWNGSIPYIRQNSERLSIK